MAKKVRKRKMTLSQRLKLSLHPVETKGPVHICSFCGRGIMGTVRDPVISARSLGPGLYHYGCSKKVWQGETFLRRGYGKTWKVVISRSMGKGSAFEIPQARAEGGKGRWRLYLSR